MRELLEGDVQTQRDDRFNVGCDGRSPSRDKVLHGEDGDKEVATRIPEEKLGKIHSGHQIVQFQVQLELTRYEAKKLQNYSDIKNRENQTDCRHLEL